MLVEVSRLEALAVSLLRKHGVPEEHAGLQTDLLIEAELRGLPSHGLQRLPRLISRIDKGLVDAHSTGIMKKTKAAFATVDGAAGLGPVVMMATLRRLYGIVPESGVAVAAIHNANHIGMLAYYAEAAASAGFVSIIMSTSEALVHPFGGTNAMLGTNPIAVGIPADAMPFVLDLATSKVSMGKIHNYALRGLPLPTGWAVDAEGCPTTDANAARTGAIAPFGDAKGYGLGLGVELLVSLLAGSAFAPEVRGTLDDTHPANKGDVVIMIDPSAGAGQISRLAPFLDRLRDSRPLHPDTPVAVPGDGARARRAAALATGIELDGTLLQQLRALEAA